MNKLDCSVMNLSHTAAFVIAAIGMYLSTVVLPATALAAVSFSTDRIAFESSNAALQSEDFESISFSFTSGPIDSLGFPIISGFSIDTSSTIVNEFLRGDSFGITPTKSILVNRFDDPVQIDVVSGTTAFGVDLFGLVSGVSGPNDANYDIQVLDTLGAVVAVTTISGSGPFNSVFLGINAAPGEMASILISTQGEVSATLDNVLIGIADSAETIYSNLGPGDSWSNANGWSGPTLCTPVDCPTSPGALSRAVSFISTGDFLLTSIELAVSDISDPLDQRPGQTPFDVGIYANNDSNGLGKPGQLLGSATTIAPENRRCNPAQDPDCLPFFLTPLETLTIVDFSPPISVASGDRYWIGLHPNNPQDYIDIAWWWNYLEDAVQSLNWSTGGGGEINFDNVMLGGIWENSQVQIESAFRVNGIPGANEAPTASAGNDQSVRVGDTVTLDGSASFDDNTPSNLLQYSWNFSSLPDGSGAILTGSDTAIPSFVVDLPGNYVAELIVTDEAGLESLPDDVVISSDNLAPTASAGLDQLVIVGSTAFLDGSGSSDPEGDFLTYSWTISSAPIGSTAALIGADTATPSFVTDLEGLYDISLSVSDPVGPGTSDGVEILAVSSEQFAVVEIVSAAEIIVPLGPEQVTTEGNQNALMNFLTQATVAVQEGDLAEAINKLQKAISRTDGCALRGAPDGNGPGRDWITSCSDQEAVYASLNSALDALIL